MADRCGERIRAARLAADMTQKELAEKLNISAAMISQWEGNVRNPKKETLQAIAVALGCSYFSLAGFDESSELLTAIMNENEVVYKELLPMYYRIQAAFSLLNIDGAKRLASFAEDLAKITEYQA